jgi:hypothetical protein
MAAGYQQQAANWGMFGQVAGGLFNAVGGFDNFAQKAPNKAQTAPNYFG